MYERNYFINGITELLILSILSVRDSYAYEITKTIQNHSDNLLTISQNTIYGTIYKLQSEGKISEYSMLVGKRRTRIYYHIEDNGSSYLQDLQRNYQQTITGVQAVLNSFSNQDYRLSQ